MTRHQQEETRQMKILVIDADQRRAEILETALVDAGYTAVSVIYSMHNLVERIEILAPDVIIIDLENPDRDTLDSMFQVSRAVSRPIAMFVDQADPTSVRDAVDAGVSAYVVDGLSKQRVQPVVEMAVSRFRAFDKLRQERDDARSALADRKVIDRAKGLLMSRRNLSEDKAYAALREAAMQRNKRMVDIAESIITAYTMDDDLFGGTGS